MFYFPFSAALLAAYTGISRFWPFTGLIPRLSRGAKPLRERVEFRDLFVVVAAILG